jgi:hypothetical protein
MMLLNIIIFHNFIILIKLLPPNLSSKPMFVIIKKGH